MADVRTEGLNTTDTSTSNPTHSKNMTVEKQTGQSNRISSKNRTTQAEGGSGGATTASPTQLKVALGSNPPISPKKNDSKTSPTARASGVAGVQQQPRSLSQQVPKNKGNPWHKTPTPASGGSDNKKQSNSSPEVRAENDSATPQIRDSITTKSISIPKDQVCGVG